MPGVQPNNDLWLAQQIAQLKRDVAALKAQRTQFVINPSSGVAETIIGDISHDPSGNPTGLTGFGIAVWDGTAWLNISSSPSIQAGQTAMSLTNGINNTFTLPRAWPHAHIAFVVGVTPGGSAPTSMGGIVLSLSTGGVWFTGTSGPYNVSWISAGH